MNTPNREPNPSDMSYPAGCHPLTGIVLAGGQGSRVGGGKHRLMLRGRSLLDHAIARLSPQVDQLIVSCNDAGADPVSQPILPDPVEDRRGPLAGILAGLEYLRQRPDGGRWLLTVPVDTPDFPADLAMRLCTAAFAAGAGLAVACSPSGEHPVFGLWNVALCEDLRGVVDAGSQLSVRAFQRAHGALQVQWDSDSPFANINTLADLAAFEAAAAGRER